MAKDLAGNTALITGGAKRIGRTIALALADARVNVVIHYRSSEKEAESAAEEVRARGARTIVLAEQDDASVEPYADVLIRLPKCSTLLQPIVAPVPLQLFACELATAIGHDVDQPRNLAKSVTVE